MRVLALRETINMTKNNLYIGANVGFTSVNNKLVLNIKSERDGSGDVVSLYSGPAAFNFDIRLATLTPDWCRSQDEKNRLADEIRKHSPIEIPGLEESVDKISVAIQKIKDDPDNVPEDHLEGHVPSASEIIPIEVNSIEEIPVINEEFVNPISFDGLPEYNVAFQYIKYIAGISDTYQEYSFQSAMAMLSAVARRKLYFRIHGNSHYTNMWFLNLGQSGYSRKSASMTKGQLILKEAVGDIFLPPDTTPEGLIAEMSDIIRTRRTTRNGEITAVEEQNKGKEIRRAECALWVDEAGQFYSQLNKPHMAMMKEMLCKFYDCPSEYPKRLSNKEFLIKDIYFNMNLSTTPIRFSESVSKEDVSSGFLARHNIVNPQYDKERMPITQDSEQDIQIEKGFVKIFKGLHSMMPVQPIRITFSETCMKVLDVWAAERENYFRKIRNEMMGSFFARFQVGVLKLAILIELGNIPSYICAAQPNKNDNEIIIKVDEIIRKNALSYIHTSNESSLYNISILLINNNIYNIYSISDMGVSLDSLKYAIKLYDTLYLAYTQEFCVYISEPRFANYLSNIYKILHDKKIVEHNLLMRYSHVPNRNEFAEIIKTLKESNSLMEYRVRTKTKPLTVYVFVPQSFDRFSFNPTQIAVEDADNDITIKLTKKPPKPSENGRMRQVNMSLISTIRTVTHPYSTQPTEEVYNQIISSVCEKLRLTEEEMNEIDDSLALNLQEIYKENNWVYPFSKGENNAIE
jgi:hypothetical protein